MSLQIAGFSHSIQKFHEVITVTQTSIAQVAYDCILSSAVFIPSALITAAFMQERFKRLLWHGTIGGISIFVVSRLAIRILRLKNRFEQWIPSAILAVGLFNIQSLIHELGHVLAGTILLQRPKVVITIIPFFGGNTKFIPMTVATAWKNLKTQYAFLTIVICGPLTTLGVSFFLLQWGIKALEIHPEGGRIAICAAIIDILFHVRFAISALHISPTALQHDFVAIRTLAGIHPLICGSVILGSAALFAYIPK